MINFVDGSSIEQSVFQHINPKHLKEWNSSRVDLEITILNVKSLSGSVVFDYFTYGVSNSERLNSGRLPSKYLHRYAPAEFGMWWCGGIDILTGEASQWGQGKADTPYSYQEKAKEADPQTPGKIKTIKYETPVKVPTEAFFLRVPRHIWQAIGERYNVALPEDIEIDQNGRALGFWAWVIANPQINIILTEGAKKAGALLSAGYCGVALPGISNGYRQPKNELEQRVGSPYLIPQLAAIAQEDREIDFCFDHDTKPKTVKAVRTAICKTGYLFQNAGCQVKVITWNYPEKGVDDLIAARGVDCFHQLYRQRTSLGKFKLTALLDLSAYNPLKICVDHLDENLVPPADANLIGLKSAKSTGKSTWLEGIVQQARDNQQRVLALTHREQLSRLLAEKFFIDYRTEVHTSDVRGALGYSLVIDSLHPNANPPFNPNEWHGAVVIIDEVEQALWHLLDSTTCRYQRVQIIESFRQLLQTVLATGGKVYVADADLSPISLDYIRDQVGFPIKPWIVENTYLPNQGKRTAHIYTGNDPREMVAQIFSAVESEQKVLIHVSAQKRKSQWGSINLESSLARTFPNHRILRIDSESVANSKHPAYGCIDNLDSIIADYDIVIASPVLETGVSIDIKHHFDSVWAIAQGVQSVDAVCQTIERLRDDVPRHLWIKNTAKGNRVGSGETSIKGLLRSQRKLAKANISLLQQADIDEFAEFDPNFSPTSLTTWAKRACVVNMGKNNYRHEIVDKLAREGYKIEWYQATDEANGFSADVIKEHIQETKTENYNHHCEDIAATESPNSKELEQLNNQRAKTTEEQLKERKGNLERLYGVEVDAELVKQDDQGWYPQLLLYYYLSVGNKYLDLRDRKTLRKLDAGDENKGFAPDINQTQLSAKIKALKILQIEQFLDPTKEFTNDSLAEWWEMILANSRDIHLILGVGIGTRDKDTPIAAAQRLLKKLGLKLNFLGQQRREGERDTSGIGHKRVRVYQGCSLESPRRDLVFAYWLERDRKLSEE